MKANGRGRLYSSDFPYIRLNEPEKYIGIVVEPDLRSNWNLYLEGDGNNLPKILKKVRGIGIFYYDSDKSYRGRRNTILLIAQSLEERGVIVMDDTEDNSLFHDYLHDNPSKPWRVVIYVQKYIGLVGGLN